jgi:CubicO group peptidase (beta-lactamase class C family)
MKLKVLYVFILFLFFFLIEITIGFTNKKNEEPASAEEAIVPISFRITNNLSTTENTLLVDEQITSFMQRYNVKGASVAITVDEKLVYAKGFGYANKETKELVEPKHLFRIASVSKLITAIAIMQLEEQKKLRLDDTVFGEKGILNDSIYHNYSDKRYENITVEHLLTHTSGLPGKKGDPLFQPLLVARKLNVAAPVSSEQTIQYALENKLRSTPGKKYSYSNIGYAVLGEVIEKISGTNYEDYVKFNVLQPLGINDMHIGKNYYEEKFHNEVKYYPYSSSEKCYAFDGSGKSVLVPYGGNNIEVLGPAGGWVASAPELIKLIAAVDGYKNKPDLLNYETISKMIDAQKTSKSTIGWRGTDGYGTWWRTGTLSGTSALVVRQKNGINWVVLLNTSTKNKSKIHNILSKTMFELVRKVPKWPEQDLFHYYKEDEKDIKLATLKNS